MNRADERADDPYSRLSYRRLIAWPRRIRREWPFLEKILAEAPSRRLLDLGCGTGEHARFLAEQGFDVVGVDLSESMIAKAREVPLEEGAAGSVRFVLGDAADLDSLVEGGFGGALSIGNMLPHVREQAALRRAFAAVRRLLLPGAAFCLQILNYEKIFAAGQRHLPLNFRAAPEGDAGEVVFLRLMTLNDDGTVIFNPTSLHYRPGEESPVEVVSSKNVHLRGWKRTEIEALLDEAGFSRRTLYGGMEEKPYEALDSADLVVVAR